MRVSRRLKFFLAIATIIAGFAFHASWILPPLVETRVVGAHQRSVMRSLAKWAQEDLVVTNDASAIHAAEMVVYVSSYYVPGEGYRGPAEVEAALETQRQRTIRQLVTSLERYTGITYGTNVEHWAEWARQRKEAAESQGDLIP